MYHNKIKQGKDYFIAVRGMKVDRVPSAETILKIYDEYSNVLTGIEYFKGTFSIWDKDDMKPYQMMLRCVAYMLQEPVNNGM